MIAPQDLSEEQLDAIAQGFESVEACDRACLEIFIKNKWSLHKTIEWAKSDKCYIKRAAFIIMMGLAIEDKEIEDFVFSVFIPILKRESSDKRAIIQEAITQAAEAIKARNPKFKRRLEEALKGVKN